MMNSIYKRSIKRLFDWILSVVGLFVLSPVILIAALFVRTRLGRPILFTQERAGRDGQPFTVFKFRTMTSAVDNDGKLLPDAVRLTPLGSWLRKLSIDELPQLVNVVRGEMSLVGPRPLLIEYVPRYSDHHARRHEVTPGITGWAQVNGRNEVEWDTRLDMDVWYVDNQSFWLDLKIILMTLHRVIVPQGINAEGEATVSEFMGSKEKN